MYTLDLHILIKLILHQFYNKFRNYRQRIRDGFLELSQRKIKHFVRVDSQNPDHFVVAYTRFPKTNTQFNHKRIFHDVGTLFKRQCDRETLVYS